MLIQKCSIHLRAIQWQASTSRFDHQRRKPDGWIKITCFNRQAEVAERYLHKGARIAVAGYLNQQKWETDEGVQRSSFQLIVNTIEFIKTDGRGFEEGQDGTPF